MSEAHIPRYRLVEGTARRYAVIDIKTKDAKGQPLMVYQTNDRDSAVAYCNDANRQHRSLQ